MSSQISTIAEFNDGKWSIAGSLKQARDGHFAIKHDGLTMIVGGWPNHEST